MRLPSFLFALCLVAVLAFAGSHAAQRPSFPSPAPVHPDRDLTLWGGHDSSHMWRRAEIRVVPLEQLHADQLELETLRNRVSKAEAEGISLWFADATMRRQLQSQVDLMKDLLQFAEQQQSDRGKSPTAVEVERRLNQIEGQVMCEACHSGIVAHNRSTATPAE